MLRRALIHPPLLAGKSASAADLIHLAEGERWLELMLASGELSAAPVLRDALRRRALPDRSAS